MLTQAVTFWRRLFGTGVASDSAPPKIVREERRSSIRFPVNEPITYELAGPGAREAKSGCIRDISLGGVKLSIAQPIEPGELLTLHLPSPNGTESNAVLSCVVHVSKMDEETWVVGCTFARNLTEDDISPFLPDHQTAKVEQRKAPRYPLTVTATYTLVNDAESVPQQAEVMNISSTGIALCVPNLIDVGALLSVDLLASDGNEQTILACVVRLTQGDENGWIVGCTFIAEIMDEAAMASFSNSVN
ncbi:MAG: PilZ domain-containing protein [Gemmataceae bacterium]